MLAAVWPAFLLVLEVEWKLGEERAVTARSQAVGQASLVYSGVEGAAASAHQLLTVIAGVAASHSLQKDCGTALDTLRRELPEYGLLAILSPDGQPACISAGAPIPPDQVAALAQPFAGAAGFSTGRYADPPGLGMKLVTFGQPFPGEGGTGLVIVGLDLRRLDEIIRGKMRSRAASTLVRDANCVVLSAVPPNIALVGSVVPTRPGLDGEQGTVLQRDRNGSEQIIGYISGAADHLGVTVTTAFDARQLLAGTARAKRRGAYALGAVAVFSLACFLLVGYRYLRAPAAVLLRAAHSWRAGKLDARAVLPPGSAAELGQIARAFNAMAATLQAQHTELSTLNEALEIRVAERTRALLDSNNRLQIEIAERELTESNLRQAQKLQAVGQLAGGAAQEFDKLLKRAAFHLSALHRSLPGADKVALRLLDSAVQVVDGGLRLTEQLSAFSRRNPLRTANVDVGQAITRTVALLTATLGPAIRLQHRVDDDLWPCRLDVHQFEAALLNLALNARDAMPRGGRLSIFATNTILLDTASDYSLAPGEYVAVIVSDTGIGMSEEVANRAFEPFFTTKEGHEGAGLGLSQVHGMVHQLGGGIRLQSQPGDGTAVTIMLPRSFASAAPGLDPERRLPAPTILLVDDDEHLLDVTAEALRHHGCAVVTAPDAPSALARLESDVAIDFVIADYVMPGMNGRELLGQVRRLYPGLPCLLATGYADAAADHPGDDIILKPFRLPELLARLRRAGAAGMRMEDAALDAAAGVERSANAV